MSTDRELARQHVGNFKILTKMAPQLRATLKQLAEHANDGYPTSVPLAPATTNSATNLWEGLCAERSEQTTVVTNVGRPDRDITLRVPCDNPRPCPVHDGAMTYTTTERAALSNTTSDKQHTAIEQAIRGVTKAIGVLDRTLNIEPATETPMCSGGQGREGSTAWGNNNCTEHADPRCAGLGLHCYTSMNRWRQNSGLERIELQTAPMCIRTGCLRNATVGRLDGICDAHRKADSRLRSALPTTD